jgi:hypothetical protein
MSGLAKNAANQTWLVFAFNRLNNVPLAGDAANITAKIRKDFGTATATNDTNPTEIEDGYYEFDLTQAETNADVLDLLPESSTANIQVIGVPGRIFTESGIVVDGAVVPTAAYATVANVRAFKVNGSVIDLTMFTDAEIEEDIALASSFIDLLCNTRFYQASSTVTYDGNGLTELYFYPEMVAPCISITSVQELDVDGTTVLDTFVEDDDFKLYAHYLGMVKSTDQRPRLRIQGRGVWPQGEQNIKVVGVFGHSGVPLEIKRATILLTLERLLPGSANIAPKDVTQASWPDFTVTYRGGAGVTVGSTTGYPEVDRLLFQHVNPVDMFLAVPNDRQYFDVSPFRKQ